MVSKGEIVGGEKNNRYTGFLETACLIEVQDTLFLDRRQKAGI